MKKLVVVIEGRKSGKPYFCRNLRRFFFHESLWRIVEKWRDFLRVEWWKDCGVETKNLWRNPWKSGRCRQRFPQPVETPLHSPPQEIPQRQKAHPGNLLRRRNFFSTWVSTACGKRCGKPEILWRGGGKLGFSKKSHVSTGNARQKKAGEKKKALRNCFLIRLLQLSAAGERFLGGEEPPKSLSADSEIPCARTFGRTEKGTKSDSFLRGANKTAPRVKPERKGLIFAMSRWNIANGFPAAQKTACNPL